MRDVIIAIWRALVYGSNMRLRASKSVELPKINFVTRQMDYQIPSWPLPVHYTTCALRGVPGATAHHRLIFDRV